MLKISKIKKILKSIIPSVILLMNFTVVNAQEIVDINNSSDYSIESIRNLSQLGIISGDEKGNFNPKKAVTRAEMIKMIVKALNIDVNNVENNAVFKDVKEDDWAFKYVQAAYNEGIVNGISEDEFGKDQKCTREQMAVMFVRALNMNKGSDILNNINGLYDIKNISNWAQKEVDLAIESGLMNGTGNNSFDPQGDAKREQVAVVIDRFIKNKEELTKKYVNYYKYPEFYNAVKKATLEPYKGKISSVGAVYLKLKSVNGEEGFIYSKTTAEQLANSGDYQTILALTNDTNLDLEFEDGQYEIIKIGNKLYIKEFDIWEEYEADEYADGEIKVIDSNFYDNFNKYSIKSKKDVYLNETHTTQYTVELKEEDILNELESYQYSILLSALEDVNYDELKFTFDYFINDKNEIIQIKVTLDTINVNSEDGNATVDFNLTSDFRNIGEEIKINPPANMNK